MNRKNEKDKDEDRYRYFVFLHRLLDEIHIMSEENYILYHYIIFIEPSITCSPRALLAPFESCITRSPRALLAPFEPCITRSPRALLYFYISLM